MDSVRDHFDRIAPNYDAYKRRYAFYYLHLKELLRQLIPAERVVLEIGCGTGDLLAWVKPRVGYGVDISPQMIKLAQRKYPSLHFTVQSLPKFKTKFDYIFACDVVEHLENLPQMFSAINKLMSRQTIFVCTMANPIWEPVLLVAEKLGLKMPEGAHRRHSGEQISKYLRQSGLKVIKHDHRLLLPIYIPLVSLLVNSYLEPHFKRYAFIEYFIIKKS